VEGPQVAYGQQAADVALEVGRGVVRQSLGSGLVAVVDARKAACQSTVSRCGAEPSKWPGLERVRVSA